MDPITVNVSTGQGAARLRARPGQTLVLTAEGPAATAVGDTTDQGTGGQTTNPVTGSWTRLQDGKPHPPGAKLTLVMDRRNEVTGTYRFTADGTSPWSAEVQVERAGAWSAFAAWRGLRAVLFVAVLVGIAVLTLGQWSWNTTFWTWLPFADGKIPAAAVRAYVFAGAVLAAGLGAVDVAGRASSGKSGLRSLVVGADGRGSTSKSQYLLWTIGLAFALAYIAAWAVLDGSPHAGNFACRIPKNGHATKDHNCVDLRYWQSYLVLLGIPAGTAVIAKGVTVRKIANGRLQKPQADDGGWAAGLTTNDKGESDIVDAQYLIFNVVTFAYVAAVFAHSGVLAGVPPILYGLTGTGALAYTLNKSLQDNAPRLQSVTPSTVHPGDQITIRGVNLFPAGATDTTLGVMIGGIDATVLREKQRLDQLRAVVPNNVAAGNVEVSVITSAGLQTPGLGIFVDNALRIWKTAVGPATTRGSVTLQVRGLPASAIKADVTVDVDGHECEPSAVTDHGRKVEVAMPHHAAKKLHVFLRYHGRISNTLALDLHGR